MLFEAKYAFLVILTHFHQHTHTHTHTHTQVIPQLIARIDIREDVVRSSIHNVLMKVGRAHPQV